MTNLFQTTSEAGLWKLVFNWFLDVYSQLWSAHTSWISYTLNSVKLCSKEFCTSWKHSIYPENPHASHLGPIATPSYMFQFV